MRWFVSDCLRLWFTQLVSTLLQQKVMRKGEGRLTFFRCPCDLLLSYKSNTDHPIKKKPFKKQVCKFEWVRVLIIYQMMYFPTNKDTNNQSKRCKKKKRVLISEVSCSCTLSALWIITRQMCKHEDTRESSTWADQMTAFIKHSAAPDLCLEYNGGCHQNADCNQTGLLVNCTCQSGYQGDGFSCDPINRWAWPVVFA